MIVALIVVVCFEIDNCTDMIVVGCCGMFYKLYWYDMVVVVCLFCFNAGQLK